MIYSKVIIVGGGPSGSTCAWKLKKAGIDCIILDKEDFPKTKLCAGWITPRVFKLLELQDYPNITPLNEIYFQVYGLKKRIKTKQYSIRRYEFDEWLLKRSNTKLYKHNVKKIKKQNNEYIIDDKFKCEYLIGAGGTFCPVYNVFFKELNPRTRKARVSTMEEEFEYDYKNDKCYIWFFKNKLKGYSWYVPKKNGIVNVGLGGFFKEKNILEHWEKFTKLLEDLSLIKDHKFKQRGYIYYIRKNVKKIRIDNAFILGDAAGLATTDLGEGIGPAIESGILAANSIINNTEYSLKSIPKRSLPSLLFSRFKK